MPELLLPEDVGGVAVADVGGVAVIADARAAIDSLCC